MVFTAIIYRPDSRVQKTSVTIIAETFEQAQKKLLSLYGKKLVSIIFELEKNFSSELYESKQEKIEKE